MQNFLVQSLIASVVLTVLLNVVPRLFPNVARRAEQKVAEAIEDRAAPAPDSGDPRSKVKVFFPWKAMLAISVGLTILVNLVGLFAN